MSLAAVSNLIAMSTLFCNKILHFIQNIRSYFISIIFPNLADYPDMYKTPQELIKSRGFESETHMITNKDGYILQTIRIVNPHVANRAQLPPVLLHHGFQVSSTAWLVAMHGKLHPNGKYIEEKDDPEETGNSLGFVLAASGYDVWLANSRGTIYSRHHVKLDPASKEFWNFNMDDMVEHDLPALIDYIKLETKRDSIGYIGHSQGSLMMFNLLSTKTYYADSIKPFIAISPIGFFTRTNAQLILWHPWVRLIHYFRKKHIYTNFFRNWGVPVLATNLIMRYTFCYAIFNFWCGFPWHSLNFDRLPIYMDHMGQGSSTQHLLHFFQHKIGFPTYYDYGNEKENFAKYRQDYPPIYNYANIISKHIAMIYSKADWFNHLADIQLLKNHLNVKLIDDYAAPDCAWNHIDLLWGKKSGKYVNTRVLEILKKYDQKIEVVD